ncbi:MAG: hypothetical protein LBC37_05235, partial [Zoogloeaceae bacterium]|nr:hypothetical protein [Zoogloeaceae bacterium]
LQADHHRHGRRRQGQPLRLRLLDSVRQKVKGYFLPGSSGVEGKAKLRLQPVKTKEKPARPERFS